MSPTSFEGIDVPDLVCLNEKLTLPPSSTTTDLTSSTSIAIPGNSPPPCDSASTTQRLSDPPYENYFYSDCHVAAQVVVTSPEPDSNLSIIGPRLIAAWPAGNSGIGAFFSPTNGINGSLGIEIINSTGQEALSPYYNDNGGKYPNVGVYGLIRFNTSAELTLAILGSVRTVRDFTEGPSLLVPEIQEAIRFHSLPDGGKLISRAWLDNATRTELGFIPTEASSDSEVKIHTNDQGNSTLRFEPGDYVFYANINYPQLAQLNASIVLNDASQGVVLQNPDQTSSLSFLSYSEKLLAGAWRFLTYFGRDSMIAALLLQPVLSDRAVEAVLGAVLERINRTDGSVCHEETIGDYATYQNKLKNVTSTDPTYSYVMIDTDYYLPILMNRYLSGKTSNESRAFLQTLAGSINPANTGLTYADLASLNAQKIMETAERYAAPGNQTIDNLVQLKEDQPVGEWRDSNAGLGSGRIPFDVNTGLVPAALRSISSLSSLGIFPSHESSVWPTLSLKYALTWETTTLPLFSVSIPASTAQSHVSDYIANAPFSIPSAPLSSTFPEQVAFYALALNTTSSPNQIPVMNSDTCFRLFLLNPMNTTNSTQLTHFLNATANSILAPFPTGLMTDVGMVVANPAYARFGASFSSLAPATQYYQSFTTSAYHGTVVWSWPMAMMARGLETHLALCTTLSAPAFCLENAVYGNVRKAYNTLWEVIEKNEEYLAGEVWSWVYKEGQGEVYTPLGALPPPAGANPIESDIRQLWSLVWLGVKRDERFR
ncbi:MAG: hypothetical protein Q9190_002723 [Brigantiaea leucoxantha]